VTFPAAPAVGPRARLGRPPAVAGPVIVGEAAALPAFPRYERLSLRLIGVREFVWLRPAAGPEPGA